MTSVFGFATAWQVTPEQNATRNAKILAFQEARLQRGLWIDFEFAQSWARNLKVLACALFFASLFWTDAVYAQTDLFDEKTQALEKSAVQTIEGRLKEYEEPGRYDFFHDTYTRWLKFYNEREPELSRANIKTELEIKRLQKEYEKSPTGPDRARLRSQIRNLSTQKRQLQLRLDRMRKAHQRVVQRRTKFREKMLTINSLEVETAELYNDPWKHPSRREMTDDERRDAIRKATERKSTQRFILDFLGLGLQIYLPSTPQTSGGSKTDPSLTKHGPITESKRNLVGESIGFEGSIVNELSSPKMLAFAESVTNEPTTGPSVLASPGSDSYAAVRPGDGPPGLVPSFVIRGNISRATGSATDSVPTGGPDLSAFNFITPSALFGSGVGLGLDGQMVKVDTTLWQVDADASVFIPLPIGQPFNGPASLPIVSFGAGLDASYQNRRDEFDQWDLTFGPNLVNMTTTFKIDDFFVAPRFALRAMGAIPTNSGAGPLLVSLEGFVSPGVLVGSGSAEQNIHIGAFNDQVSVDDHKTKFAYRAGVMGKIGVRPGRNIDVGVKGKFIYQSASNYWVNPVLATEQPAHLEQAYSYSGYVGGYLTIAFGADY